MNGSGPISAVVRKHTDELIDEMDASTSDADSLDIKELKDTIDYLKEKMKKVTAFSQNTTKLELLRDKYFEEKDLNSETCFETISEITELYTNHILPVLKEYGLKEENIYQNVIIDPDGVVIIDTDHSLTPVETENKLIETYLKAKIFLLREAYLKPKVNEKLKAIKENKSATEEELKEWIELKNRTEEVTGPKIRERSNEVFKEIIKRYREEYDYARETHGKKLARYGWLRDSHRVLFDGVQSLMANGLNHKQINSIYLWDRIDEKTKENLGFFGDNSNYNGIREAMNQVRREGNRQNGNLEEFENVYHAAEYDLRLSKEEDAAYKQFLNAGRNATGYINNGFKHTDEKIKNHHNAAIALGEIITEKEKTANMLESEYNTITTRFKEYVNN